MRRAWHYFCLCLLFSSEPLFSNIPSSRTAKCQVELSAAAVFPSHSHLCPVFEVVLQCAFEQILSVTSFPSWHCSSSCSGYQVILLTSAPCSRPPCIHGPTPFYLISNMETPCFLWHFILHNMFSDKLLSLFLVWYLQICNFNGGRGW